MCQKKASVGIFSREHASCYKWLIDFLLDSSLVRDVNFFCISNKSLNLTKEIHQCTFAILYHTKNRGRINVTDVTDSLYDDELQALSEILGRKNVVVVIDDLEDTSEVQKNAILKDQPSIGKLAQDLLLFGNDDKRMAKVSETGKSHQQLRGIIKDHNRRLWVRECSKYKWLILAIFFIALIFLLIALAVHLFLHYPYKRLHIKGTHKHA